MEIPEQFNRKAPDYATLNDGEVWGPFVVVHPRLGELLGAQMSLEEDRVTWFTSDEVGRIIVFSEEPKIMEDGSIVIEEDGSDDVYTIRPLKESDYANFNVEEPASLEEVYDMANAEFEPFELEDDEEE
jgi:hypothetical protein